MKTATVRDIRTRFPTVEGWLAESGVLGITKAGKLVAKLIPANETDGALPRLDFAKRYPLRRQKPGDRIDISGILMRSRE
jgi:antitoxin (DNA-binding transcriptional repressor) of toxin-antitoxin stability system